MNTAAAANSLPQLDMLAMPSLAAAALNPAKIIETGAGFWPSKVLLTAVELDVFTTLGARALTGVELQRALGLHSRGVHDFLDTLVALGFLDRVGDGPAGRYRNTPQTAAFLDKNQPCYIGGMLEMLNARLFGSSRSRTSSTTRVARTPSVS